MTATGCPLPGGHPLPGLLGRSWPGEDCAPAGVCPALGWLASGAAHHDLRGSSHTGMHSWAEPSPPRAASLDCSAPRRSNQPLCLQPGPGGRCGPGVETVFRAQAAGPGFRSCRWPWRAVCSCWTCPSSRILREAGTPRLLPAGVSAALRSVHHPSWVSSTRLAWPVGPGGLASLGPRHSGIPQLQVTGWRGTSSEPGCVLPSPGAGRAAAAGRPGPAWVQTGQHWGCAGGLPALRSCPHGARQQVSLRLVPAWPQP